MSLRTIEHHAEAYFVAESNRSQLFLDFYTKWEQNILYIRALISRNRRGVPARRGDGQVAST
jgi:hypothetical protein